MNAYDDELERIDRELRDARQGHKALEARIEHLENARAAIENLRAKDADYAPTIAIDGLRKADAILKILTHADRPMSISEIAQAMTANGNKTQNDGASVYLDGLLKAGKVARVERGVYRSA